MPNEFLIGMPDNMPVHLNEIDFPLIKPEDTDIILLQDVLLRMLNKQYDYSTCSAFIDRLTGLYEAVISDIVTLNIALRREGIVQSGYLLNSLEKDLVEGVQNCEKVISILNNLTEKFIYEIAIQSDILEDLARQIKLKRMMANTEITELKATFLMIRAHKPN